MKECPACRRCFADNINNCPDDGEATNQTIAGEPILDGRYQLEKRLGQGGMGAVYKARHIFLKTWHAVKVILPDLVGNDPNLVTRFRQEALAAAAIRHPNVIAVTDYGVVDGRMPFLVMEFVKGQSLHEMLVTEGAMPASRVVEIMSAICGGVAAAHRQKIVHRDLKPLNIMLQEDLSVAEGLKVLDFGLAKIKSGELLGSFVQAQTTGLMGSPFYMAPEQWNDEEPDARADIYSLGIMMYQMLTGDVPFKGNAIPSIMKKHLMMEPPPMGVWGVQVPAPIEAVARHALQKERAKRPPTAEALLEELRQAAASIAATLSVTDPKTNQKTLVAPPAGPPTIDFATSPLTLSQPTTTLRIRTYPAQASVFVNNVPVGTSDPAGDIIIRNMLRGTHRLMVAHAGYAEWVSDVACDEGEFDLEIALDALEEGQKAGAATEAGYITLRNTNPDGRPGQTHSEKGRATTAGIGPAGTQNLNATVAWDSRSGASAPQLSASQMEMGSTTVTPPAPPRNFVPILLGALLGVLLLGGVGAYLLIPRGPGNENIANRNDNQAKDPKTGSVKNEPIAIPGGTFKMGRKNGTRQETPEHAFTVQSFVMDKTEVTNAEYSEFVKATKYPAPDYFTDGVPPTSQEQWPVCNVNLADAQAFAKWRSQRDGVEYRLPTEEEWEYAARNGDQNTVYPWGNTWKDGFAATKESKILSPQPVGGYPKGQNGWGVQDLIGNVWEFTSSKATFYPGNNAVPDDPDHIVVRGGHYGGDHKDPKQPVSSIYRIWVDPTLRQPQVGFRLVRSGS